MPLQDGLHVLQHRIEIVAIDRRVIVTIGLGETMRGIAPSAGVHELALAALLAKIDRSIARRPPARLVPDLVDRMIEDVEPGLRDAIACDPQHIMSFDRAIGHDGAKLDRLVAYALGRRV